MPFSTNSSKGIIEGNIKNLSNKPEYNLDISFENLSGADIQELKDKNFSPLLKQFNNFSGNARGHLSIKEQTTGNMHRPRIVLIYFSERESAAASDRRR